MKVSKQKPTLFDILAIAVPGFITLYLIFVGLFDGDISKFGVAEYVCAFAVSCLVGMVIHWISKLAFEGFMRNRYEDIKAARDEFMKWPGNGENEREANIDVKYIYEDYKRRYYLALEYGNSDIPVLEAQIAFIRNMFFVMLFSCVVVCCKGEGFCIPSYCVVASLLLIDVVAAFYMFSAQKKIYFHVYEDSYYMEEVKGGKKEDGANGCKQVSKSPICHLLVMAVLGFVVLFSIAGIASKDGVVYVTGIFGNKGLVFPRYVCIFAASYFVGEVVCIIGHLCFVLLSGKFRECVKKCVEKYSDKYRWLDLGNVLSSLCSILVVIALGLTAAIMCGSKCIIVVSLKIFAALSLIAIICCYLIYKKAKNGNTTSYYESADSDNHDLDKNENDNQGSADSDNQDSDKNENQGSDGGNIGTN